jgi:hypothetical protein
MKKKLLISAVTIAAAVLGSVQAYAQENEKVVTGKITLMSPTSVEVLDEYISNQLYSGGNVFTGLNVKLGAFYSKQDKVSWDLYYNGFGKDDSSVKKSKGPSLTNPARSQKLNWSAYNFGYGSYYNWQFFDKLMIKAGGMIDAYIASKTSMPDGVNNYMNIDGQLMLKALTAIKYGWDFEKWGLDIRAQFSAPLLGVMIADHPSETVLAILGNNTNILDPAFNHIFFASYHNFMSFDYEAGIDFVLKPFTLSLAFGGMCKWWNVNDLQNIRKLHYTSLGISFDLVPRCKFKSSNRNF